MAHTGMAGEVRGRGEPGCRPLTCPAPRPSRQCIGLRVEVRQPQLVPSLASEPKSRRVLGPGDA